MLCLHDSNCVKASSCWGYWHHAWRMCLHLRYPWWCSFSMMTFLERCWHGVSLHDAVCCGAGQIQMGNVKLALGRRLIDMAVTAGALPLGVSVC